MRLVERRTVLRNVGAGLAFIRASIRLAKRFIPAAYGLCSLLWCISFANGSMVRHEWTQRLSGSKAAVSTLVVGAQQTCAMAESVEQQLVRPLSGKEILLSEETTQRMTLPVTTQGR
jgi:hypothetical protein